ncbi:hypothetical protein BDD12DRAFT_947524, partial [Trichophaea hybrida]
WPLRLLHVPSMTSYEWTEGNKYGNVKEPPYNTVSYTWGCWKLDRGPSLPVKGVGWTVPAVDENHFSVTDLQNLVKRISIEGAGEEGNKSVVEHVWIDMACIDQENNSLKMKETGRQAVIFEGA